MSGDDNITLNRYHDVAKDLALKVGEIFCQGYYNNTVFKNKLDFFDLVTVYDKQIEDIIINGFKQAFPGCKFIGEEEMSASNREVRLTDEPTWIIDPIDGTTNFINRIPHCCISLGLSIKKELVVGVIYNPVQKELYSAIKGHGAYLNGKKITVTDRKSLAESVLAYEISLIHSKSVRDKNLKRLYKLASNALGTRCFGSAAITFCYMAKGMLSVYHIDDLNMWDIAAGVVILKEAGGFITNSDGTEFDIEKPNFTAATTKELLSEVQQLINEANSIIEYNFA